MEAGFNEKRYAGGMTLLAPTLFDHLPDRQPSAPIPGLRYLPDFIDAETEATLLATIDQQPWLHDLKRRVQHYGWRYDYKARGITQDLRIGAIPDWLAGLCERLSVEGIFARTHDQVIINEYQPGQGISAHVDCVPCFGDTIASLRKSSNAASISDSFSHDCGLRVCTTVSMPISLRGTLEAQVANSFRLGFCVLKPSRFAAVTPAGNKRTFLDASFCI